MTSHRLRFLASLSERIESDLAARERESDDLSAPPRIELIHEPGAGHEPSAEQSAGDQIGGASAPGASQFEPQEDAGSEAGAPPHDPDPGEMSAPTGATVASEAEHPPGLSTPWSETGLPVRLREAIASVRRVSHEMHEPPHDDDAMHGPEPLTADEGDDDAWADDPAYEEPPPDSRPAWPEHDPAPEGRHPDAAFDETYEEPPPDDELVLLDEAAGFEHEQMRLEHDAYQEPPAEDELGPLDDDVIHEDGQTGLSGEWASEEPPPGDQLIGLEEEAGYRHGPMRLDDAPFSEPAAGAAAGHVHRWLDVDREDQEFSPGRRDDPQDRPALRRGVTTRYRVHAAALAIAIAFVALAGFGLGILSGGGDRDGPLARDTVRAEARPSGAPSEGRRAAPGGTTEPNELVTVRVGPVAGVPAAAAGPSARAMPLPPPPKPVVRQSATEEAAPSDGELAEAVDDAAAALLESDGAGGPFEPLFAKLPASLAAQTRVFVHYSASAVGAPATAMHLVRQLKSEGFAAEARAVEFPIPTNSIRYFFDADRDQAEAVRSSLEQQIPGAAAVTVMDFTSYEPKPRPGLLEVWLRV